jgi:CubicO group peptidase (beta-lactamase class C family)
MIGSTTRCASRAIGWLALAALAGGTATQCSAQQAPWPTHGWSVSSPEAQGLDSAPLAALTREIEAGAYGNVDRLVVVRNGYLVASKRWERDYRTISRGFADALGCGAGTCPDTTAVHQYNYYHPDHHPYYQGRDVHSLQSVTKSVTAVLIGIAIGRGDISGPDAFLVSFFENYDLSRVDERLRRATLDDLLTMRSGIEWHEDRPFDSTNTTLQLEWSEDWIQFTLDQPMDADPGEKWAYNSGGSHLMSGIVKAAAGKYVDEYAEAYLFGPLGVTDYHWKRTPKGYPDTEGGLYLEAEQLAKIGYLYLNDGVWDGQRILPEGWVRASTARHVESVNRAGWGYGYQWWRPDRDGTEVWAGLGFGGQFLLVLPEHQLIGVVNCWNLFGGVERSILRGLLEALLAAAAGK